MSAYELYIRVTDDNRHQPYRLVNGLYRLDVGPSFARPCEAMRYVDSLNAASEVSPLPTTSTAHDPRDTPRSSRALRGSPESAVPLHHRG